MDAAVIYCSFLLSFFIWLLFASKWSMIFQKQIGHCCLLHKFCQNLWTSFFCFAQTSCSSVPMVERKWNETKVGEMQQGYWIFCIFILSCKSKKSFQDVLNFLENCVTITFWKSWAGILFRNTIQAKIWMFSLYW